MRHLRDRNAERVSANENPEYLRGYRDGIRDQQVTVRRGSGDGILGALLAIALIFGIGYLGYNYATTGRILSDDVNLNLPVPGAGNPQP